MLVWVDQVLRPEMPQNGLGGIRFVQEAVARPHWKDLGAYDNPLQLPGRLIFQTGRFSRLGWRPGSRRGDGGRPHANEHMLEERDDLAVLWDLRVDSAYWGRELAVCCLQRPQTWSPSKGFLNENRKPEQQMCARALLCQKGAVLGAINTRAYRGEPDIGEEIQLIWYLDLAALPQAGK